MLPVRSSARNVMLSVLCVNSSGRDDYALVSITWPVSEQISVLEL
jgi:hypothetical protein